MKIQDIAFNTVLLLFKGNHEFFVIIDDFHNKLPPKHKRAEIREDIISFAVVHDTSKMKMNLTTQEIDIFHKKLENFNYDRIAFKKKRIKTFSANIQRLIATSRWESFGISLVQTLLEDDAKSRMPYLFGYRIGRLIGF